MSVCSLCGADNPAVATFCMSCGNRVRTAQPRGQVRKSVTIVFCDVTGSTPLAERLDPEAVRGVMSRYFEAMRTALEMHGGTVEKFIGDAVMAVFGLPHAHEDDALRAVRSAADMRAAVRRLGHEIRTELGVEFSARIGVNTGEVVAGDAAAGQAMVTGDAVNVAARLEQNAPPGEVLLGAATYRLVRNAVTAEPIGPLLLKGKAEPLPVYRLEDVLSPASEKNARPGTRLIGRQVELEILRAELTQAIQARECRTVTLIAPAGTGKSRLVEEFLHDLPSGAQALKGRCLPYGEGITYFPITQVVKQAVRLTDFDDPARIEHGVRAVLADEEHQGLVGDRILQLLGIGAGGSPEDTLWAVRRFVEAIARRSPLVLVLEDLHWAEPTLLDLVEHIGECSEDAPLLVVGTARPELLDNRPAWARNRATSRLLALEPLSGSQCHSMISELLGGQSVPDSVTHRVAQAAGGTPLFVEEMVAMMVDEGWLRPTTDGWTPTGDLTALATPPSISALLAARLDRLSDDERRVLDAGSVVGQEFLVGAIRELVTPELRPATLNLLMAMVRKELLRPDRSSVPGEDAFRFRHELVRDAAYDALPKQVRADLHGLVAAWMERVAADRIAEHEEIIGYHFEQAHRYRTELSPHDPLAPELGMRAGRALAASGLRASARGDVRATANLLGRADSLLAADDLGRLEMLPALAEALDQMGDIEGAADVIRRGMEDVQRLGDARLEAHLVLADLMYGAGPVGETQTSWEDRAQTEARASLVSFEQAGDLRGAALAQRNLGFLRWGRGAISEALGHWELSAELAGQAGDSAGQAHDLAWIQVAHYFDATPASQILPSAVHALSLVAAVPAATAEVLWTVSSTWGMLGDLEQAQAALDESRRIDLALGRAASASHFATQVEEEMHRFCGDLDARIEVLRRGVSESEALGQRDNPLLRALLAEAYAAVGADELAWSQARSTREAVLQQDGEEAGPSFTLKVLTVPALRAEAAVLARRGDDSDALARAHDALETLQGTGYFWRIADVWMTLAQVHELAGRKSEAASAAAEALERYEHKEIRRFAMSARDLWARLSH